MKLGQAAYEAYKTFSKGKCMAGYNMPPWDLLPPKTQEAWEASAVGAVAAAKPAPAPAPAPASGPAAPNVP